MHQGRDLLPGHAVRGGGGEGEAGGVGERGVGGFAVRGGRHRDQAQRGLLLRAFVREHGVPRRLDPEPRAAGRGEFGGVGRHGVPGVLRVCFGPPGVQPRAASDAGGARGLEAARVHDGRASGAEALRGVGLAQTRRQLREPRGHRQGGRDPGPAPARPHAHHGRRAPVQGCAHGRLLGVQRGENAASDGRSGGSRLGGGGWRWRRKGRRCHWHSRYHGGKAVSFLVQ
mmetsp:Transcript_70296/g.138198  ORF Transcript_70296/g.138198 Transcript_70296/m.138198 type:complete len:228 (+) Transcript_70296:822-1505(+)